MQRPGDSTACRDWIAAVVAGHEPRASIEEHPAESVADVADAEQVVVLLASIATGANVYLMSRQFKTLEGPVASSLVLSTGLAALTTPLVLTLAA